MESAFLRTEIKAISKKWCRKRGFTETKWITDVICEEEGYRKVEEAAISILSRGYYRRTR
ncbi:hypothetical protein ACT7DH_10675 [Bacillus pacificus]